MATSNQSNVTAFGVSNSAIPPGGEGPKTIPLTIDFTAGSSFQINLETLQQRGYISALQSLFYDNSTNTSNVSIQMGITGQTLYIPSLAQAYLPILLPNPPVLTFTSSGSFVTFCQLINMPMPACVWKVS